MASPSGALRQSREEIVRLIGLAIMGKYSLMAIYDGRERLLCPQMIGRNRAGNTRVLCLQVAGESASGLIHDGQGDWRCLSLEKFSGVERATASWRTAGDSLRRPKCIDYIELEASSTSTGG